MQITTRQQAKDAGLPRYFTGEPCRNGHLSERQTANHDCIECKNTRSRDRYATDESFRNKARAKSKNRVISEAEKAKRSAALRAMYTTPEFRAKRKSRLVHDVLFSLNHRIGSLIRFHIRKAGYTKASRTHEILGCDWPTFKQHIERQFMPGMSWANRDQWHIDHIVPASSAKNEDELLALNHFTNLRPLWATENQSKNDSRTYLI